jgi:hypothetical protein
MFKGKASIRFKSGAYTEYVSILNRIDELLNIHKNRCEIPLGRGNAAIEREMHFWEGFLYAIRVLR